MASRAVTDVLQELIGELHRFTVSSLHSKAVDVSRNRISAILYGPPGHDIVFDKRIDRLKNEELVFLINKMIYDVKNTRIDISYKYLKKEYK